MIEIFADTACILYLGLAIGIVLGIWMHNHIKMRKKKVTDFSLSHRTCEFCAFTYLDEASSVLSRCPQCHLLNHPHQ